MARLGFLRMGSEGRMAAVVLLMNGYWIANHSVDQSEASPIL